MSVLTCTVLPGKRPGLLYFPRDWQDLTLVATGTTYSNAISRSFPPETGIYFSKDRFIWKSADHSLYLISNTAWSLWVQEGTGIWFNRYNEPVIAIPVTEFEIMFEETFQ